MSEPTHISPAPRDQRASVRGDEARRSPRVAWVAQVAGAQWGVVDLGQLRECGVGKSTAARWAVEGRLHRVYPGVYAVGHAALPVEGELTAALFSAGPGATLSHATAAWWWGLIEEQPSVIEISVPRHRRAPAPHGVKIHHPRRLDRTSHRRLPVTPVIQTLLDFAAGASVKRVRRALAEAEFRDLLRVEAVAQALGRGRAGSATLRAALESHQPLLALTRSALEEAFLELCEGAGLPTPEVNTMVCGYLVDAVWWEQRVAVELDGLRGHRTPAQLERDHERDLVLRQNGFETRRYTWRQVTRKGDDVVADLPRCVLELAA